MTFGSNINQLIEHVYGNVDVSVEEMSALESALVVDGDGVGGRSQLKAMYSLFKTVTYNLLHKLNELERVHGGLLRIRQPTDLKLPNVIIASDDVEYLSDENRLIGINNIRLNKLIERMKEMVANGE